MAANKKAQLIIEKHPETYTGFPFITLIKFRQQHILTIIDNRDDKIISAYVLDDCESHGVDEQLLVTAASDWHERFATLCPFSIYLAKQGIHDQFESVLKTFSVDFVSRVIGPVPTFKMSQPVVVRKKRKKVISAAVEIHHNVINIS